MLSPPPSRMETASRGPSFHSSILGSSCFHTQSLGHLLQHNPAIMTSQVERHLSAGTGGELSGAAGRLVGLRCLMAAAHGICVRRGGIRMFSYHMLLQCSKRPPTPESHTKSRLPISMDLKVLQFEQRCWLAQHRGSVAGVLRGTPPPSSPLTFSIQMGSHVCEFKAGYRCDFFSAGGFIWGAVQRDAAPKSCCRE